MAGVPLSVLVLMMTMAPGSAGNGSCFDRIFSFGDSLADTGNYLRSIGNRPDPIRHLPYGSTFFGRPTGRFSNGRLVVDFLAEAWGLPLVRPYLVGGGAAEFEHGANFAVAGATALDNSFFAARGVAATWTEFSLSAQIQWFRQLRQLLLSHSNHSTADCSKMMSSSLFLVGEIGGNDYNHPFFNGIPVDQVRKFVPSVINSISSAINDLIALGATVLVVPGNFPIGCVPIYLTVYKSLRKEDYDAQTGCIKWLNEFSEYHNRMLVDELDRLRQQHPHATVIYADYYGAAMNMFRSPRRFGFKAPLVACCGGSGPYNWSSSVTCGNLGSTVCVDPPDYVSWDGLHLTEAAYKVIANAVLQGSHATPSLAKACSNASSPLYSAQCSGCSDRSGLVTVVILNEIVLIFVLFVCMSRFHAT